MEIKVHEKDANEAINVEVSGAINTTTAPAFLTELQTVFVKKPREITLDFAEVTYVSSAGLRVLLIVQKTSIKQGIQMSLYNVDEEIRKVFSMTGFMEIIKIRAKESARGERNES